MDLNVVDVLQLDVVLQRQSQRVSREVTVVGGVLEQSADAARCQNGVICVNGGIRAVRVVSDDAEALVLLADQIHHGVAFNEGDVCPRFGSLQQMAGDLLARFVLMEQDPRAGMGPLLGIDEFLAVLGELNAEIHQISDHLSGGADHNIHRVGIVFVVSRPHGVLIKGVVIRVVPQNANAALGQEGITFGGNALGHDGHAFVGGEVQGTVKSRNTAANDHDIGFHIMHLPAPASAPRGSGRRRVWRRPRGSLPHWFPAHGAYFQEY